MADRRKKDPVPRGRAAAEPARPGAVDAAEGVAAPAARSSFARDPGRAQRRYPAEDRGRTLAWRGPYERDRDRLVHSRAFRRLADKSQLLPREDPTQARNRLTRTLEIASAARSLARHLGLDEDLAEAIALAHDLGQPPFGAAGARALDAVLRDGAGIPGAADVAGFDVRVQSLRVVDLLEVRYDHPGLNLTDDTREGVFKLDRDDAPVPEGIDRAGLRPGESPPLEALAVRAALEVVTPVHDLEDALGAGLIELGDALRVPAVAGLVVRLEKAAAWPRGRFRQHAALHRALVHAAVTDVLVASRRRLPRAGAGGAATGPVAAGPKGAERAAALRELVGTRVVGRPAVRRADARGARTVEELLRAVLRDPRLLDDAVLLRYKELAGRPYLRDLPRGSQEREIAEHYHGRRVFLRLCADHVAGMTDRYAQDAWEALVPGRSR